ncbi:MAG: hypothetical protein ACK5PB_01840 [Pirellula sp.]
MRWGPRAYFHCDAWAREMEESVPKLIVHNFSHAEVNDCWFLTGRRFWYQTAYCAWSLERNTRRTVVLNLINDGTLEQSQVLELRRLFPSGITVDKEDVLDRLNVHLPEKRFPYLRKKWRDYINIRKLIDVHLGSKGPKLVLDSDMLFFSRPEELMAWVDNPQGICLMTDCIESYGYSRTLMESLCGASIPSLLNVGVTGLTSELIDWDMLESWTRSLIESEGNSYYLEQALIAMLAARSEHLSVLPAKTYITFPTQRQVIDAFGVLQHYVADSKPWYFGKAWKLCLKKDI